MPNRWSDGVEAHLGQLLERPAVMVRTLWAASVLFVATGMAMVLLSPVERNRAPAPGGSGL